MSAAFFDSVDNLPLLEKLLNEGEHVNREDPSDKTRTILHKACIRRKPAAVKLILKHKPNINLKDEYGSTPLHYSCRRGDLESSILLLDTHADVNAVDSNNRTPLYLATYESRLHIVKLLLNRGADPNIVDHYNSSPLHRAKCSEVVELLVAHGSTNINAVDWRNNTPLNRASRRGDLTAVQELCKMGSNINHKGYQGHTALHQAIVSNHIPAVRYLLAQRPDISVIDDNKLTVLELAKKNGGSKQMLDIITTHIDKYIIANAWFVSNLKDSTVQEGDRVVMQCETNGLDDDIWLRKDGKPVRIGIEVSKFGNVFKIQIGSARVGDGGFYSCILRNGMKTTAKLIVKDVNDYSRVTCTDYERLNLVKTCVAKLQLAGTIGSGKTTLSRSLRKGKGDARDLEDRTIVLNVQVWEMEKDVSVPIYDMGGHDCYLVASHFFYCDDPRNIILLLHSLMSTSVSDYHCTFTWAQDIINSSPQSTLIPVLTKSDLFSHEEVLGRKAQFIQYFSQFIDKEIEGLKKLYAFKTESQIQKLIEVYQTFQVRLRNNEVYVINCKNESTHDLQKLSYDLKQLCLKYNSNIPEVYYYFYKDIGSLGLVSDNPNSEVPTQKQTTLGTIKSKLKNSLKSKTKMTNQPVASVPLENTSSVKFLTSKPEQNDQNTSVYVAFINTGNNQVSINSPLFTESPIPEGRSSPDEIVPLEELKYTRLDAALEHFREINTVTNYFQKKDIGVAFEDCLKHLHSVGLVLWFYDVPESRGVIFTHLSSFIDIIKSIFNHNLDEILQFKNLSYLQKKAVDFSEAKFLQILFDLKHKGKMSRNLLELIIQKLGLLEGETILETVVGIFKSLGLCLEIPLSNKPCASPSYFMPWFSQGISEPEDLSIQLQKIALPTKDSYPLEVVFEGYTPRTMYHFMCVSLFQFVKNSTTQRVSVWNGNMYVDLGYLQLLLSYTELGNIILKTNANVTNVACLHLLWDAIGYVHERSQNLKETSFPGMIFISVLKCPHCSLEGIRAPKLWILDDLLGVCCSRPGGLVSVFECPQQTGIKLPAALIHPLPKGKQEEASEALAPLKVYLKKINIKSAASSNSTGSSSDHKVQLGCERQMKENEPATNKAELHTLSKENTGEFENREEKETISPHVKDPSISQKLEHQKTEMALQVQQMLTQHTQAITEQIATGFDQMADHHRGLAHGMAQQSFIAILQSNDASRLPVKCRHPVLSKNQEMLQDNLNVDSELLNVLSDRELLITIDDRKSIEQDRTHLGKVKRVLFILEREQPVKVREFIEAIYQCESDPNATLAVHLGESYDNFAKAESEM